MDDNERTNLAQSSKDARRRAVTAFLRAVCKDRAAKQRLFDTEDRMERAVEAYQRSPLAGAHLPPMLSTIRGTAHTLCSDCTPSTANQPDQGGHRWHA